MRKELLLCSVVAVAGLSASAQRLADGYVTFPASESLHDYVSQWVAGQSITVKGEAWEDENFFISRVKPKTRFINRNSQVYNTISDQNDKRYIWWVPVGSPATNAIPDGTSDGETFSMWSYIDHYGDWTSPYGWVPGAFADAAHKNGVAVSGVASIPNSAIPAGWKSCLEGVAGIGGDNVGKFLYYHGVDGLGYNSEFSAGSDLMNKVITLHNDLYKYMGTRNPIFENIWYGGTTDGGSISFDRGVGSTGDNTRLFQGASIFLNYNWNNITLMNRSIEHAESVGKSPFYIYAGMNQQGGEPKSGDNYPILKDYKYSIGVWGAHEYNMFWQDRASSGSAGITPQYTYQKAIEQWFGNGPRNPAIRKPITTNRGHRPTDNWAGMSSMMSARSVLSWDLSDAPFVSYFNLGSGQYFNWNGDRVSDHPWYNIAVQDYLPTWRFWFSPTYMNGNVAEGSTNLQAAFSFDEAYFGGSSLRVSGSTTDEYLQLFKTEYTMNTGDTIVVRYKLLSGEADIDLAASLKGEESKNVVGDAVTTFRILAAGASTRTYKGSAEARDMSLDEGNAGWVVRRIIISNNTPIKPASVVAQLGLRIRNAKNMELMLGEMSIRRRGAKFEPVAPVVTKTKVLANNYSGIDGKIIFDVPFNKTDGAAVYNDDVNISMFRLWAQEEGGEPQFMGVTTSWAGICFSAPNTDQNKKIRFGVSAVSKDYGTESAPVFGEWLSKGDYQSVDDVELDKTVIKPDQKFVVRYVDPLHASSNWRIYNAAGQLMAEGNGVELTVENGLPEVGGYDLVLNEGTAEEHRMNYFIQISGMGVGAYPEIQSLTLNDQPVVEGGSPVTIKFGDLTKFGYTGAQADGNASRGLYLNEAMIGTRNKVPGTEETPVIAGGQSWSLCTWVRFEEFPDQDWAFFNVTNRETGTWPASNWGWCWSNGAPDGTLSTFTFRGSAQNTTRPGEMAYKFPKVKFQPGVWTHVAFVFEYEGNKFRFNLYINGVKQESTWTQWYLWNSGAVRATGTTDDFNDGQTWPMTFADNILFGGQAYQGKSPNGTLDDMQLWGKALTADEVKEAMAGFDGREVPQELIALWDFEADAVDKNFKSTGSNPDIDGFSFSYASGEAEGSGTVTKNDPVFMPGSPFIAGTAYPVVTKPSWKVTTDRRATISGDGTHTEGEATINFADQNAEEHHVQLTLANSYGEHTMEYPVIKVEPTEAIEGIGQDGAGVKTYTVDESLFVEFAESGSYTIEVFNAAGMLMARQDANVNGSEVACISLSQQGVYIVNIYRNGQKYSAAKVVRK